VRPPDFKRRNLGGGFPLLYLGQIGFLRVIARPDRYRDREFFNRLQFSYGIAPDALASPSGLIFFLPTLYAAIEGSVRRSQAIAANRQVGAVCLSSNHKVTGSFPVPAGSGETDNSAIGG
jgi:hypothetical protein